MISLGQFYSAACPTSQAPPASGLRSSSAPQASLEIAFAWEIINYMYCLSSESPLHKVLGNVWKFCLLPIATHACVRIHGPLSLYLHHLSPFVPARPLPVCMQACKNVRKGAADPPWSSQTFSFPA